MKPKTGAKVAVGSGVAVLAAVAIKMALSGGGCPTPIAEDARLEIQGWIDGACGDLSGTYNVDAPPPMPGVDATIVLGAGKSLTGDATINFVGSAPAAWNGIRVTGPGVEISGVTLTTTGLTTHDEQSHVIEVVGDPIVKIHGVTFHHPQKFTTELREDGTCCKGQPAGDCIRFLGQNASGNKPLIVVGGEIYENNFAECDRSAVAWQRETRNLDIHNNIYGVIGDNYLDGEITSGSGGPVTVHDEIMWDFSLKGRSCVHMSAQPGPFVGGTIRNTTMLGCGTEMLNATGATMDGVGVFMWGPRTASLFRKGTGDITITGSLISGTSKGAIAISSINGILPGRFTIIGSQLETLGTENLLDATDPLSITLVDTDIIGVTGGDVAIGIRGLLRPVESFSMTGSDFIGPFEFCSKLNNVTTVLRLLNTHGPDPDNWTPIPTCQGL
jgi:hypothetical protein